MHLLPLLVAALLAALMGAAIQRGATCLVAAVDEIVHRRAAWRLLAMLEAGLAAAAVLAVVQLCIGPVALAPPPAAGWWTLAGGLLLGLGAWLARACVFGAIARIGNGEVAWAGVPLGFLLGALATVELHGAPSQPAASLPAAPPAAAIATLGAATLWLFWRVRHPRPGERLLGARNATILIGILFALLLPLAGPWAWTDAVAELAATGMAAREGERLLLVAALFAGAVAAGLALGRFRLRAPRPADLARTVAGGALMAAGSLLVPGSNDGLLLLGVPMLWAYALLALGVMAISIAGAEAVAARAGRRLADGNAAGPLLPRGRAHAELHARGRGVQRHPARADARDQDAGG